MLNCLPLFPLFSVSLLFFTIHLAFSSVPVLAPMAAHKCIAGKLHHTKKCLLCGWKGRNFQWNTVLNSWSSTPLKRKTLIHICCFGYLIKPGNMSANICTGRLRTTSWNVTSFKQIKFICYCCRPQARINVARETWKNCWLFMITPPEPTWITCCSEDCLAVQQISLSSCVRLLRAVMPVLTSSSSRYWKRIKV